MLIEYYQQDWSTITFFSLSEQCWLPVQVLRTDIICIMKRLIVIGGGVDSLMFKYVGQ